MAPVPHSGDRRLSVRENRAMTDWTKRNFDEIVELSTWDVLRVAPAVIRSFEAGPDGLDLLCIGGRKPRGGDTEKFADFWT